MLATALFLIVIAALASVMGQWLPSWNHGFARPCRAECPGAQAAVSGAQAAVSARCR